jgi:hypothetical protein
MASNTNSLVSSRLCDYFHHFQPKHNAAVSVQKISEAVDSLRNYGTDVSGVHLTLVMPRFHLASDLAICSVGSDPSRG